MATIATIDPTVSHEITFDLNINGTKEEPQDIRFIIESQIDPATGGSVQDVFSIICRAVRSADGVKITIPRLLNLFRSGSYKSRLEVVLEGRLFVPLSEEITILEPPTVAVSNPINKKDSPSVSATLSNIVAEIVKPKDALTSIEDQPKPGTGVESVAEKIVPVDKSWRSKGFSGIKNPFRQQPVETPSKGGVTKAP